MRTTRSEPAVGSMPGRILTPGRGWPAGRTLALLVLALSTLAIDGCSSLGCKSCGGGCRLHLFGRRKSAVMGAPIEPGAPMVIEQGSPGATIAPGSTSAGGGDAEDNSILAPLNSKSGSDSSTGGSGASSSRPSGASLSNKDHASNTNPRALRSNPRRIASGTRALSQTRRLPRNEPANGPARRNELAAADALLNDLPAPATEIGGDVSPPPAPEAGPIASPAKPASELKKPSNDSPAVGASGSGVKQSSGLAETRPTTTTVVEPLEVSPDPATIGAAPGIKRFKAVDLKLAAGSFPNGDGLAWLAEKGYRTVLDLREPAEVRSGDLAAVNHQALRYVALPVSESSLSVETYKKFEAELAQAGARPLYFFDGDGARAAALWYVKRIVNDLDDEAAARKEVAEIGALTPGFLKSAQGVVSQLKAARAALGGDAKSPQANAKKGSDQTAGIQK